MARSKSPIQKLESVAKVSKDRRLPSVRELASTWGISTRTVQSAVAQAVAAGWLETKPGSGIWNAGFLPKPIRKEPRLDAQRLADNIATEIQSGKFLSNQVLPAPKDYSKRLGIHPKTVRNAFEILRSRNLVDRQGRSWRVSRPRTKPSIRTPIVQCIGAPGLDGKLRMDSDPEWDFWREIQAEATRSGLEPKLSSWTGELPRFSDEVIGVIVSNWHMLDSRPVLDRLLRRRLPTAVWVGNDETLPGTRYRQVRSMWFHDLAVGRVAGRTMAEFVAKKGHRKVAWISPFHASPWARNRLAGLRESLPGDIELFEANGEWTSEWEIQQKFFDAPEILSRFDLDGTASRSELRALALPLVESITRERSLKLFGPRLEAALESGATLWVAASDLTAQWCLHWLRSHGLKSPDDLAIASFDDTREATRLQLTSLRFDVQEMARAMIRQVTSASQDHRLLTQYNGHVVERSSTSPPGR